MSEGSRCPGKGWLSPPPLRKRGKQTDGRSYYYIINSNRIQMKVHWDRVQMNNSYAKLFLMLFGFFTISPLICLFY